MGGLLSLSDFEINASGIAPENVNDFDFVIDQDIIVKKEGNMDGDLILKAGTYSYDRSIGQYGGYQFELFKL